MQLLRSIDSPHLPGQGCVLTIGNFDGVHRGHQKILSRIVATGGDFDLPTVVMTFLPSPEEFFQGERAAPRLTTVASRFFAIEDQGVDFLLALPFNRILSQTSASEFIRAFIVERLKASHVLIGDDFRFGKGRQGNFRMLEEAAEEFGFTVERFETVSDGIARISSTRIRNLLCTGELDDAAALLGRRYAMCGRVSHGDKRGRTWGFPTLNIPVHHKLPMTGVFAVVVDGAIDGRLNGVANLGTRPTIGGMKTLLEVHLFGFSQEIYGRRICVEFVSKIRDERKFDSFDALKQQIMLDCDIARNILLDQASA